MRVLTDKPIDFRDFIVGKYATFNDDGHVEFADDEAGILTEIVYNDPLFPTGLEAGKDENGWKILQYLRDQLIADNLIPIYLDIWDEYIIYWYGGKDKMKHTDWDNVTTKTEYKDLPAGGYICGITAVEDFPDKEYLRFEFDIAGGEYNNFYREIYDRSGYWIASFIKSYSDKSVGYFKAMLEAFADSNKGFVINSDDEQRMKRKYIGLTIGYEEYIGKDKKTGEKTVKTRIYVDRVVSVDDIESGNFKIPKYKSLDGNAKPGTSKPSMDVIEDDDDLPWK